MDETGSLVDKAGPGIVLVEPGEEAWQVELEEQRKFAAMWKYGGRRPAKRRGQNLGAGKPRFVFLDPEATPEQVEWLVARFKAVAMRSI